MLWSGHRPNNSDVNQLNICKNTVIHFIWCRNEGGGGGCQGFDLIRALKKQGKTLQKTWGNFFFGWQVAKLSRSYANAPTMT